MECRRRKGSRSSYTSRLRCRQGSALLQTYISAERDGVPSIPGQSWARAYVNRCSIVLHICLVPKPRRAPILADARAKVRPRVSQNARVHRPAQTMSGRTHVSASQLIVGGPQSSLFPQFLEQSADPSHTLMRIRLLGPFQNLWALLCHSPDEKTSKVSAPAECRPVQDSRLISIEPQTLKEGPKVKTSTCNLIKIRSPLYRRRLS